MKNTYRINVRFDLDNPAEKHCLEYLQSLSGSWSKFIIEAVKEKVQCEESGYERYLGDIRNIIREELAGVSFVSAENIQESEPQQSTEDSEADILNSLSAFGL